MIDSLNYAYGQPKSSGQIKVLPQDFCVEENLGFELTGEGEHLFLFIEKTLLNTEEMVQIIAQTLQISMRAISYAGLKDKYATTKQWFSLHLPGLTNPDLSGLDNDRHRVLNVVRHNKKLKIGSLKENHFVIRIKDAEYDEQALSLKIEHIKSKGVPNYFGPQRFGHNGNNLERAKGVLLNNKKIKNRHLRGIYFSAARSFLFNQVLSLRVKQNTWNTPLPGDVMMLAGSNSLFQLDEVDNEIMRRVDEHDISPAAALWGEGSELLSKDALEVQSSALAPWNEWCSALEAQRLQKSYRPMILVPKNLVFKDDVFSFTLPKGTYATTVLREIFATI